MSFKELSSAVGNALYRQVGRANGRVQTHRPLPVDLLEDETSYLVIFDAPGAEPDDIQVRYLEGTVKIRIDRFRQFHDGYEMRFPGRGMELEGEAELPGDAVVEPDAGTAKLTESGALRIEIPKASSLGDDRDDHDTTPTDAEELTVEDRDFGSN
ncbi:MULTISPECIES: Hsp20/alpha crystallin family protein [Natrialbaceae]|uniref:Hsp20/alpha crystallin family protein n=1 Tax=Natrialbaceae TaxID=1644061 RepID=UPI00207C9AD3|nr:Hsp20 family protein [Natronococcus sp. CG52]